MIDIVADHVAHGYSAAQIVEQYPDLTPAQVHAALTSYYDHQGAMDSALVASYAQTEHERHLHTPDAKLVAARAAGGIMLRLYMDVHIKAAITEGKHVELIQGDILTMASMGEPHALTAMQLNHALLPHFNPATGFHLRIQMPLALPALTSE